MRRPVLVVLFALAVGGLSAAAYADGGVPAGDGGAPFNPGDIVLPPAPNDPVEPSDPPADEPAGCSCVQAAASRSGFASLCALPLAAALLAVRGQPRRRRRRHG